MIRIGIVGCGSMGGGHRKHYEALKDRVTLAGFADIDLKRARAAAGEAPGAVAVTDYRELLEHVDAVVITLPHDLHYEVGTTCLDAGKHVLMEKPLALNAEQARAMVERDTTPDPVLMVGYVMRYEPLWVRMGEMIRNEEFGPVFHAAIWTEQFTDVMARPWYGRNKRAGGGQLFSHGCHYIDLLLDWMGPPSRGSHVSTNMGTPGMEREGTSNVCLRFDSGATAYHFGTWGAQGSYLRWSAQAHTPEGLLHMDHDGGTIQLYRGRTPEEVYRRPGGAGKPVAAQMRMFLDCIENGTKPLVGAADSLRSLEVIWRLYDAEDRGIEADLRGI